jgi:transposase
LSWHKVKAIDEWYVRNQGPKIDWTTIECIGIDEFSLRKNHEYATRVMDLTNPEDVRTIWVGRHRKAKTVEAFYEQMAINGADPGQLKAVCQDDWGPYKKATKQYAPQAQIVQDPFHLIRRMNTVMGSVRNRLKSDGNKQTQEALNGTKRLLEAAVEDVSDEAEDRLESLFDDVPEMGTVHQLKEQFRRLWNQPNRPAGREWFEDWIRQANESGIPEMKDFAEKLARKKEEIVAGCEYDLNTSVVEGFNNRTKTLQNVAFGFRDHQYYFLKIMAVHSGGSRADPH